MSELLCILPDGKHRYVPNTYEGIKGAIGGTLDMINGHTPVGAYVDDEGIYKRLYLNVPVSMILARPVFGPAVLCKPHPDAQGNTLPIAEEAAAAFETIARSWRNVILEANGSGQQIMVEPTPETLPPPQVIDLSDEDALMRWLDTGEVPGE